MDATKRIHRKKMGFIELTIRNKHQVPLHSITLRSLQLKGRQQSNLVKMED